MAGLGLDVTVFTLYGPRPPARLAGMARVKAPVVHLGLAASKELFAGLTRVRQNWGPEAPKFLRQVLARRWRSFETAGEALWAALAGVHLAGRFRAAGIGHIHAPWADGPATAAWVAGALSGIPFSFCGHAHDMYPPDGALQEKLLAASLRAHHFPRQPPLFKRSGPRGRGQNRPHHLRRAPGGCGPAAPGKRPALSPVGHRTSGGKKGLSGAAGGLPAPDGGWEWIFASNWPGTAPSAAFSRPWCRNTPWGTGCIFWDMCPTIRSPICLRRPTCSSCPVWWPAGGTGTASPM
jgi:hypothetical protein